MADLDPRNTGEGWERNVLEKVALAAIAEQRTARRWSMAFKMLVMIYLFIVLFLGMGWLKKAGEKSTGKHTAMWNCAASSASDSQASADNVTSACRRHSKTAIRSASCAHPIVGRQPCAGRLHQRRDQAPARLVSEHPIYAVVEDICASGGYYVAVAA